MAEEIINQVITIARRRSARVNLKFQATSDVLSGYLSIQIWLRTRRVHFGKAQKLPMKRPIRSNSRLQLATWFGLQYGCIWSNFGADASGQQGNLSQKCLTCWNADKQVSAGVWVGQGGTVQGRARRSANKMAAIQWSNCDFDQTKLNMLSILVHRRGWSNQLPQVQVFHFDTTQGPAIKPWPTWHFFFLGGCNLPPPKTHNRKKK